MFGKDKKRITSRKRNEAKESEEKHSGAIIIKQVKSNKLKRPYGLLAGAGISSSGLTPREAWEAWNEHQKDLRKNSKPSPQQSLSDKKNNAPTVQVSPQKADKILSANPPKTIQKKAEAVAQPSASKIKIPELSKSLISLANGNSHYERGTQSEREYKAYANTILAMDISDSKKEKLLGDLKKRWDKLLDYQAQWVPWTVSGPARYNAKKLDKSSQVFDCRKEISQWFEGVEKSVKNSKSQYADESKAKARKAEEWLYKAIENGWYSTSASIANGLAAIAPHDPERFVELYESFDKKYKFRKNTTAAKLYEQTKAGKYQGEKKPQKLHETENLNTYKKNIQAGERVFMKFTTRPKPQLIFALKKRGWHWNANEGAWSIDSKKYDEKFVNGIDENYKKYL